MDAKRSDPSYTKNSKEKKPEEERVGFKRRKNRKKAGWINIPSSLTQTFRR